MVTKKQPLKVALHGLDSRTTKIMTLFLHGPCKDVAIIVNPEEAEVDIIDADIPASKKLLEKHFEEKQQKPVIILSLWDVVHEGALHLKKPVNTETMSKVLEQARKLHVDLSKKLGQKQIQTAQESDQEQKEPIAETLNSFTVKANEAYLKQIDVNKLKQLKVKQEDVLELLNYGLTNPKKAKLKIVVDTRIVEPEELDDWFESGL
jgi:hypothetical protein